MTRMANPATIDVDVVRRTFDVGTADLAVRIELSKVGSAIMREDIEIVREFMTFLSDRWGMGKLDRQ